MEKLLNLLQDLSTPIDFEGLITQGTFPELLRRFAYVLPGDFHGAGLMAPVSV